MPSLVMVVFAEQLLQLGWLHHVKKSVLNHVSSCCKHSLLAADDAKMPPGKRDRAR
eukprot:CAMPEP_0178385042 /NCGR_PEP_ID=MMETSP0689_2-20121128/7829_1 /TAXON_ID=160604 /ORGANISM="Amphidinium massartii, Strain CS-259" /LENGTH=55 /DNA_ID=CAMNT_0020005313 /DNA_START=669 /DNA_END=836 /DNA_ORIENTATION=-